MNDGNLRASSKQALVVVTLSAASRVKSERLAS
jgi:hypothetical protein